MYTTLISAKALSSELSGSDPQDILILDCGFDLGDPEKGRRDYGEGHIPGSVYVHLEEVLSGPKTGSNGRHPLPDRDTLARALAALGANRDTQLVAYDNAAGMYAARLWWLSRWIGHEKVAVLDGGIAAWKAAGQPTGTDASPPRPAGNLEAGKDCQPTLPYEAVKATLDGGDYLILDARAPDRYRGENETIDPVGGHIPGALNRFFRNNLEADGCFLPPQELRRAFAALMGDCDPARVINQCGSGVTACHNLLAMEIAGLKGAILYPGSWSEWSSRPGAPIGLQRAGSRQFQTIQR